MQSFLQHLQESESRIKYPRTPHLPWSQGRSADDVGVDSLKHFEGQQVVVTEKMDGENTTMTAQYVHARSVDSNNHPSRNWVKGLHGQIKRDIPEGWRICGENLYAQHSIVYTELPTYFQVFSIWNEQNMCLNWHDTVEWTRLLGLTTVPILYSGIWHEEKIRTTKVRPDQEGYVVRLAASFHYRDFAKSVAKFVRKNHVQTDNHWMSKSVVPNQLK